MTLKPKRLSVDDALRAARETRDLVIGQDAITETPRVFREQFGTQTAVIVADANTLRAAGTAVIEAFRTAGLPTIDPFIFSSVGLYAEHGFVEELGKSLSQHSAIPVAVGSGTINDLTKLAAHRSSRPYLCVATAASMDGYTAFGASITYRGSKQTFECPAPTAVVADLNVIANAPVAMTGWGYADLLAKVTAGADWILADAMGIEPINPLAWNIVQGGLRELTADPIGVRRGERGAIGNLVIGLMMGGFAMQATKSSRPASGAEHQFSHLWDMLHHTHHGVAPSHGLKVGIGTLAVTALYEYLLKQPLQDLDIERCCDIWPEKEDWIGRAESLFADADVRAVAVREIRAKSCTAEELKSQLKGLREQWLTLRDQLCTQLTPLCELRSILEAAGAAVEPEQIGISRRQLRNSFIQAFFIRRRFTVLDLAVRVGLLNSCLDSVFGADGVWPAAR